MKTTTNLPVSDTGSRIARFTKDRFGIPRIMSRVKRLQPRDLSGRLARMLKGK